MNQQHSKFILISFSVFLIGLFTARVESGANWVDVVQPGSKYSGQYYLKRDSFQFVTPTVAQALVRTPMADPAGYLISLQEYDCQRKATRVIKASSYAADGKLIDLLVVKQATPWTVPDSTTVPGYFLSLVCGNSR
jgi:hypothetical protein